MTKKKTNYCKTFGSKTPKNHLLILKHGFPGGFIKLSIMLGGKQMVQTKNRSSSKLHKKTNMTNIIATNRNCPERIFFSSTLEMSHFDYESVQVIVASNSCSPSTFL